MQTCTHLSFYGHTLNQVYETGITVKMVRMVNEGLVFSYKLKYKLYKQGVNR